MARHQLGFRGSVVLVHPAARRLLCTAHRALLLVLLSAGGAAAGDPSVVGQWQPPEPWPVIAIHSALLPTGEVLAYSYPNGTDGSNAQTWNPATGQFEYWQVSSDLFCSGLSLLPDGRVYVVGGNDYACQFQGRFDRRIFDPFKKSWSQLPDMSVGRWYPTNITLGDGRVITVSGLDRDCETTPVMELYTPGIGGTFEVVPGGQGYWPLFPRLHLLTSGKVAYVGSSADTWTFDPAAPQWEYVDNCSQDRWNGTSVLWPGETDVVMIIGGEENTIETNTCERIDFGAANPQWQFTGSMHHPRGHANAVLLPDRSVLVIGGGTFDLYGDPVLIPELFDPDTQTWTELPAQVYPRMYHSIGLLLPDGRVLSAGHDSGESAVWGEIYEPPYLFRGSRPVITNAPQQIAYGLQFPVATPQAEDIGSVALLRFGAVTHSVNMEQRYVGLQFSALDSATLQVTAPSGGNHAPPGYYMLFVVDGQGVPSEAQFVQLIEGALPCATLEQCADLDSNGIRDNACGWYECSAGLCSASNRDAGQADIGGFSGDCALDAACDVNDRFHAQNCFANQDTLGTPGYPCEQNNSNYPGSALNVDAVGFAGTCLLDGACDINDAFAANNCFAGEGTDGKAPFPCLCDGGPAPTPMRPQFAGAAGLVLQAPPRARPGDMVEVDVLLDRPVDVLRGYQLHLAARGGRGAALQPVDIAVHAGRRDYVFAGVGGETVAAFNTPMQQMFNYAHPQGIDVSHAQAYLATFTFRVPANASGRFVIDVRANEGQAIPEGRTFLFATPYQPIAVASVQPAVLEVGTRRAPPRGAAE